MDRVQTNYIDFIGLKGNKSHVVVSDYRDKLLNKKYLYPVIFTRLEGVSICSTSKNYFKVCHQLFDGSSDSVHQLMENLNNTDESFSIRTMRRYIGVSDYNIEPDIESDIDALGVKTCVLTKALSETISFDINVPMVKYIENKLDIINDERQFVSIKNNEVASTAFISDIYGSLANIVVYTVPKYRNKGHGAAVVKACIKWCTEHNCEPVYFVEEANERSIQLAQKVGFKRFYEEQVVTKL